jgi:hypothetical protein
LQGLEASSQNFLQTVENECQDTMERLAPTKTKEGTTNNSLRAINVGALSTLGTFGCTNQRKVVVINLEGLETCWEPLGRSGHKEGAAGVVGE